MGGSKPYMPEIAMCTAQLSNAVLLLLTRAALVQGLSAKIYVVYRQVIATVIVAPIAYLARRRSEDPSASKIGLKSFSWIFLASFVGVTLNQNLYYEGLYFASSTMGAAMNNLIPAITFIIASIIGMEKLNIRSIRTIAKILGTVVCVGGATTMTFLRGSKLLSSSIFRLEEDTWLLGCLLLFGSACCWSLWLIIQVPLIACYPDHLSLTAWMCFLAAIQSAAFTLIVEPPKDWILHSYLEIGACVYGGVIGSAFVFFVQAWSIDKRGPLFSAVFNPLCYVIVLVISAVFLHGTVYEGSLIGAIGVIIGLYVVLWGKAGDNGNNREAVDSKDGAMVENLEEPFLGNNDG